MPTALELTREGWQPYLEGARERLASEAVTSEERQLYALLLDRVREVARLLRERFGARRVILFGSLAHGAWSVADSDVDLAVEGLSSAGYWQAWQVAEEIIDDRPVDLIELETASPSLLDAIENYGVEF
jgi:predicted nucleotidyltransferase